MYDDNGNVTSNHALSVKNVYTIEFLMQINGVTAQRMSFTNVGSNSTVYAIMP